MFAKIKDIKVIQKLICLAKLFDLDDIEEILISQANSSVCESSEIETAEINESKASHHSHTLQSVRIFNNKEENDVLNKQEEPSGSNFSFDETSSSNRVEIFTNKKDMKLNTCKIALQGESQESLKSFLRSEASSKLLTNNGKSSQKQSEESYPVRKLFNNDKRKQKLHECISDTNTSMSNFCNCSLNTCTFGLQRGKDLNSSNLFPSSRQMLNESSICKRSEPKTRERILIEKSIDKILSNDITNSTLKLRRSLFNTNRSKERKTNLQKEIMNVLEKSLLMAKNNQPSDQKNKLEF